MSESRTPISSSKPTNFKLVFLVNPKSGGGEGERVASVLPEIMDSFGFDRSEWCCQELILDRFEEQVRSMLSQTNKLIAVGGDGTMSSILGIYVAGSFQNVELGLIPLGTGNDLSRSLNIYSNYINKGLINTLRKLIKSESRPFDLWNVDGILTMAAYVSAGYDARIAQLFHEDRESGKIPGRSSLINKLWYSKIGIQQIRYRLRSGAFLRIKDARGKERHLPLEGRRLLLIGNVGSYAGGARPFDASDFSDGMLEVLSIKSFAQFCLLMVTTFLDGPWVRWWARRFLPSVHAVSAEFYVPKGEAVQVDGEPKGNELSGRLLSISYAGQAKLLVLKDRL